MGTPHKQGLAAVPTFFRQWGQWGQKQGYPQQKLCYPLILLNKQAIQHGRSNSGHRVKLDLNSSPFPSGRRFAAVGAGSPHRAGRGHQQPHQVNTAQRRLIRAGAGAGAGPVPLPPPRTAAPAPAGKQPARPWLAQGIGLGWIVQAGQWWASVSALLGAGSVPSDLQREGCSCPPPISTGHQCRQARACNTAPGEALGTVGAANCLKGQGRKYPG